MIAIQTKYLPATYTRGSRIKAYTCDGHAVTVPYDYALSSDKLHFEAVRALVEKYKLDWDLSNMRYGAVVNGYVFCFDAAIRNIVK
jgi:hypothetical protein